MNEQGTSTVRTDAAGTPESWQTYESRVELRAEAAQISKHLCALTGPAQEDAMRALLCRFFRLARISAVG